MLNNSGHYMRCSDQKNNEVGKKKIKDWEVCIAQEFFWLAKSDGKMCLALHAVSHLDSMGIEQIFTAVRQQLSYG